MKTKIISDAMESLGINYAFVRWQGKVEYPYFVGEYHETEPMDESGMSESTFILTGHTRGTWLELEETKNKICDYFNKVSGKTVIAEDGSAVAVFYVSASVVNSIDAELKKMQINLKIKEWSVK